MSSELLKYCLIPAGGVGTRWSPVTSYIPKIMIPLFDRPTVDWIVREAINSGCTDLILALDKDKNMIKRHLLSKTNFTKKVRFHFLYKKQIRGVAEAIFMSKKVVGDNIFSMIVSDHPCFYKNAPLIEMAQKLNYLNSSPNNVSLLAFAKYPKYNNQAYGECLLEKKDNVYEIRHLCPRPKNPTKDHHDGNKLRIAGRYIFSPSIFPLIKECLKTIPTGDLSDWDVFKLARKKGMHYLGMEIKSYFLDMGTPKTYGQASAFLFKKGASPYDKK